MQNNFWENQTNIDMRSGITFLLRKANKKKTNSDAPKLSIGDCDGIQETSCRSLGLCSVTISSGSFGAT